MNSFITQFFKNLTPFFVLIVLSVSCNQNNDPYKNIREMQIVLPSGNSIATRLAITESEQNKGLSGLASAKFSTTDSMLFFYLTKGERRFWMPNTYFNLDIFFLDENLRVVALERNVASHPGKEEPPAIPTTGSYWSKHVLEMRADAPLAKSIVVGSKIKIKGFTLSQIESEIRRLQ